jgi:hypothetical protein
MIRIALLAAALLCLLPASVQAATATGTRVFGFPDTHSLAVRYEAWRGETNDVTVTIAAKEVTIEDPGAKIDAGGYCNEAGPSRVVCSHREDEVNFVHVILGDGDDRFHVDTDQTKQMRISAGAGDDTLQGGISSEGLIGGAGNDVIDGGAGSDTITGGPGRDELRGGEPATDFEFDSIRDGERDGEAESDTIIATDGQASLSYRPRTEGVTVDLPAGVAGAPGERDTLSGISRVIGGKGPDIMLATDSGAYLVGGRGADRIEGGDSADSLSGEGGPDRVFGGGGDDYMPDNSDNARDVHNCGPGEDFVDITDKRDRLRRDCEDGAWLRSRRADAGRITVQPEISRRRAVFRLICVDPEGCRGRITLLTAGRRLVLGRGRIDIERARSDQRRHEVAVRLSDRGRSYLRRGGNVRVVIVGSGLPCGGCLNPRPVKSGFTTRMKR